MTVEAKKVLEDRVRDLEIQYAAIQGERRTIITLGGTLVSVVLGFLGYQSGWGIDKAVDREIKASTVAATTSLQEGINQMRAGAQKQVEDEITGLTEDANVELQKLVAELSEEGRRQKLNFEQLQNSFSEEYKTNNLYVLSQASETMSELQRIEVQAYEALKKIQENSPVDSRVARIKVPKPTPVTLLRNAFVKEGYYLPVTKKIRLQLDRVDADTGECVTRLTTNDGEWPMSFSGTQSERIKKIGQTTYRFTLEDIGRAGFNRFNRACFFTVTSTPLMEAEG